MNQLDNFTQDELEIGKGITKVDSLPFEAPWLSPFGACLINITDVRRNKGIIEFQLGDESATPYENGKVWVKADAFYSEWPD